MNLLEDRDAILDDLRMNLLRAQQKMQDQANRKRKEVEYKEGEMVYLKLKPYRQQSLARRKYEKLAARYYGPFMVIKKIGKVAYKLELPQTSSIHPVFHVSQLRSAYGTPSQPSELPRQLNAEMELIVQPEEVKGARQKKGGGKGELEVLIQWKGLTDSEATWEDYDKIQQQFPEFHLGDKVDVWAAGIDKPPVFLFYKRKGKKPKQAVIPK